MNERMFRQSWIPFVAVLLFIACARQANAQGFISPFIGYNFGGASGCPQITNCDDKHVNYGIAFGALGSFVGFEAELAHTNDFLGSSPNESTNVFTGMANFMLAPKLGPIQPYGLAGVGLIRTSVESAGANQDENQAGWDIGGGMMAFFNAHVGIRGDIRYFRSFDVLDLSRFPNIPIRETTVDFGRFSGALVFKF